MNPTKPTGTPPLREALYALSMAKRVPDAEVLDDVVREYPEFAEELTEFAVDLVVNSLRESPFDEGVADINLEHLDRDVSQGISRFHNRVYALRQEAEKRRGERNATSHGTENPFVGLARAKFREVATRLGANTVFAGKLRDGQIRPNTMTDGFRRHVAQVLDDVADVPVEVVYSHLAAHGGSGPAIRQFYKAESTPGTPEQQSFVEAVKNSGLTEEQQRYLLGL